MGSQEIFSKCKVRHTAKEATIFLDDQWLPRHHLYLTADSFGMRKAKVRGKDKKQLTLYCMYIQQINKSLCQQIVRLATNRRTAGGKSRSGH